MIPASRSYSGIVVGTPVGRSARRSAISPGSSVGKAQRTIIPVIEHTNEKRRLRLVGSTRVFLEEDNCLAL